MEKSPSNLKTISQQDFDSICRLCLVQGPIASILDLKYEEIAFSDILIELFSTQVNADDELPKNICETCIWEVIRCFNFKRVILASEESLRSVFNKDFDITIHNEPVLYDEDIKLEDFVNTTTVPKDDLGEDLLKNNEDPDFNETYKSSDQELSPDDQIINLGSSDNDNIVTVDNFFFDREGGKEDCILETVKTDFQLYGNGVKKKTIKPKSSTCSYEKTFTLRSEWIKHRKEEKPQNHSCKICTKSFTDRGLRQHMRTHPNEKPEKSECKICFQRFTLPWNLKRHMVAIHKGKWPHICEFCGKGFIRATSLRGHKRYYCRYDHMTKIMKKYSA